ncbi:hypothetical protein AGOR_G00171230 [Albula goreensis]|uniref:Histamine H3 receptor n=1 Tax=Albula goreensis TaxID=1534307 RepID=A0A8T3D2L6_9TELE|nr:hypothetical protein AGOR_G00171230 [Albula goreensis]
MQSEFPAPQLGFASPTFAPLDGEPEGLELMNWSLVTNENISILENLRISQHKQFSSSTSVFLAVLMTLLVFATVLGNALVILAFAVEKNLRTQSNVFFLNLAIADFLVGVFCIPVYIPYVLTGEWRLGRGVCKLWLVVDYMLCTASVFNIVLISFDRFLSVTRALSYRCQKGVSRATVLKMASVWLAAFLLYGPAIISWEHIAGGSVVPLRQCHAEFYFNWYFLMTASTVEFFTPFISVTYFNLSIYINIRQRNLMREGQVGGAGAGPGDCEMQPRGGVENQKVFFVRPAGNMGRGVSRDGAGGTDRAQARGMVGGSSAVAGIGEGHSFSGRDRGVARRYSGSPYLPPLQLDGLAQRPGEGCCGARQGRVDTTDPARFRLSRDKKVAKSLAVIVCVFGLCWAPYTLLMIIRAACHGHCVQHYLYETTFWLLWINSSINPVLYPLCHTSFRRAFTKLLCPSKVKVQPQVMGQKC